MEGSYLQRRNHVPRCRCAVLQLEKLSCPWVTAPSNIWHQTALAGSKTSHWKLTPRERRGLASSLALIKRRLPVQAGSPWWPPHEVGDSQQSCPAASHPLPVPRSFWGKLCTGEASQLDSWLCQSLFLLFSSRSCEAAPAQQLRAPHLRVPPAQDRPLSAWLPSLAISKCKCISSVVSHPNNGVSF